MAASDDGVDARIVRARTRREHSSLQSWLQTRTKLTSMTKLHRWLFMEHRAYAMAAHAPTSATDGDATPDCDQMPKELLDSY